MSKDDDSGQYRDHGNDKVVVYEVISENGLNQFISRSGPRRILNLLFQVTRLIIIIE